MKRSEAWGTASAADPFTRARLKLTLFYIGLIAVVVAVLSSAVYTVHTYDLLRIAHRRLEHTQTLEDPFERSFGDYVEDLRRAIIWGDAVTVVVAGGLSYLLAGRTLRPIRQAMSLQKRFFADAAHDLRTPLAVMRTEAEVALERGELTRDDAVRVINSHLEEIGRLSAMVDQMLSLIRGSETVRGPRQEVPVASLAAGVVEKLSALAARRRVGLAFSGGGEPSVHGERAALERALVNVVENALVYTPAGGSVEVKVARVGSHVEVTTCDTGIGVAAADLPHITEPFFRADPARTANEAGTGLGLTIVAEILRDHQGSLHFASRPGQGTKVTMRLPAA